MWHACAWNLYHHYLITRRNAPYCIITRTGMLQRSRSRLAALTASRFAASSTSPSTAAAAAAAAAFPSSAASRIIVRMSPSPSPRDIAATSSCGRREVQYPVSFPFWPGDLSIFTERLRRVEETSALARLHWVETAAAAGRAVARDMVRSGIPVRERAARIEAVE